MAPVIAARGLRKTFGSFAALDGLDLTVEAGQVHGFLGPNGSGKSTTLRVLLGLLHADGGEVSVLGEDPWAQAPDLHRRLAYVPGDVALWPSLTGGEAIDLLGRMRGGLDPARREELVERFALDPTKKGRSYSKGNRQKVMLVAALAADVELLLLDEPTSGLDPLMERVFGEVVAERVADGATVLLSSHILSEVEELATHVTIVAAGRDVDSGPLSELRRKGLGGNAVHALVERVPDPAALAGARDLVVTDTPDGADVRCTVDAEHLGAVMAALSAAGPRSLTCEPPSLEDVFLAHYADRGEHR